MLVTSQADVFSTLVVGGKPAKVESTLLSQWASEWAGDFSYELGAVAGLSLLHDGSTRNLINSQEVISPDGKTTEVRNIRLEALVAHAGARSAKLWTHDPSRVDAGSLKREEYVIDIFKLAQSIEASLKALHFLRISA